MTLSSLRMLSSSKFRTLANVTIPGGRAKGFHPIVLFCHANALSHKGKSVFITAREAETTQ
jgi:hypothetical protein